MTTELVKELEGILNAAMEMPSFDAKCFAFNDTNGKKKVGLIQKSDISTEPLQVVVLDQHQINVLAEFAKENLK